LFPDYLVECDEHLTGIKQLLLGLESSPGGARREQLDALFRHFHTLKGLSGIARVPEAEQLAHHLEEYLGVLRKSGGELTPDGLAVLFDGVKGIEGVIAARCNELPPPAIGPLLARVAALLPAHPEPVAPAALPPRQDPGLPADKAAAIAAAVRAGDRAWRVTFRPTPALAEGGTNVGSVRERLKARGEIVHAEPVPVPGGGISFAFVVLSREPDFAAAVAADGVAVAPYEPPAPAPAPAPTAEPTPEPASAVPRNVVRVDLGRLDELMRTVGELVITRARLDNALDRVAAALPAADRRDLQETSLTVERQLRDLREGVMRVRLVPVRDVFARMRFVVRDLARETGTDVDLVLTGEHTEIDKFVVERLADPLLHLVRNAVSHGLESGAERAAAGKPVRGRIDLRAAAAGGAVVVEVEDDGRGIDADRVFARARERGLVPPGGWSDPGAVLDLICTPGFSTRDTADLGSGRGVGMDVVRRAGRRRARGLPPACRSPWPSPTR
jgi:two-component system chemotaxis sensor kinase CheA